MSYEYALLIQLIPDYEEYIQYFQYEQEALLTICEFVSTLSSFEIHWY